MSAYAAVTPWGTLDQGLQTNLDAIVARAFGRHIGKALFDGGPPPCRLITLLLWRIAGVSICTMETQTAIEETADAYDCVN